MNKIVIVAVFIFWAALSFFYANSLINKNSPQQFPETTNLNTNLLVDGSTNQNIDNPTTVQLTKATVAQHNNTSDCWVTAGNNVYNVTGYIRSHPGGAQRIIDYCGADVAQAMGEIGHSSKALSILAGYKIGVVGATINQQTVEAAQNLNNNPSNSNNGEYEDEWEDDD